MAIPNGETITLTDDTGSVVVSTRADQGYRVISITPAVRRGLAGEPAPPAETMAALVNWLATVRGAR